MTQLKRTVEQVAADSRTSRARQADTAFYKHIAQVHFNAWHYAEDDVLSSLVDHVFHRLDLGEIADDPYGADVASIQKQFDKAALAEQQANDQLAAAERKLAVLSASRATQENNRAELADAVAKDVAKGASVKLAMTTLSSTLQNIGLATVPNSVNELLAASRAQREELLQAARCWLR